MIDKLKANYG